MISNFWKYLTIGCTHITVLLPLFILQTSLTSATNFSLYSVPLDRIILDDFQGGTIPLTEASSELIEELRDKIPPLTNPKYTSAHEAFWLKDNDLILGYVEKNDARAFPIHLLNFHEIINDTIGDREVLVSYCPLCRSGLVFDRRIQDKSLTFGNTSGLYESDMVMYDHQTQSYWFQVRGEAIVGALTGTRLPLLPSFLLPWSHWKTLYPKTQVLSRETGFSRPYYQNPFLGYDKLGTPPAFPIHTHDNRLDKKEKILGIEHNGVSKAYSLTRLGHTVVMDTIADLSLVIFSDPIGPSGAAFETTTVSGKELSFFLTQRAYKDHQTHSTWNIAGKATDGILEGLELTKLPAYYTFWFAWVAAFPDTTIYNPSS